MKYWLLYLFLVSIILIVLLNTNKESFVPQINSKINKTRRKLNFYKHSVTNYVNDFKRNIKKMFYL